MEYKHKFAKGDILYCSWGTEPRNIDFYQIIRTVGKTILIIRQIEKTQAYNESGCILSKQALPVKDAFISDEFVKKTGASHYITLSNTQNAILWDGNPKPDIHD